MYIGQLWLRCSHSQLLFFNRPELSPFAVCCCPHVSAIESILPIVYREWLCMTQIGAISEEFSKLSVLFFCLRSAVDPSMDDRLGLLGDNRAFYGLPSAIQRLAFSVNQLVEHGL